MRMEVHVHGTIELKAGVRVKDIDDALKPWLEYLDIDSVEEAESMHHDEPGIEFDKNTNTLEICWSGEVGRSFMTRIEPALKGLCPHSAKAAEIEVSYYYDDGTDELNLIFIGPNAKSIHDAQRARMIEDVSSLLGRHFDEGSVGEVVTLLDTLFARDWEKRAESGEPVEATGETETKRPNRRHLH